MNYQAAKKAEKAASSGGGLMGKLIGGGGGKKDRGAGGDSDDDSPTANGAAVSKTKTIQHSFHIYFSRRWWGHHCPSLYPYRNPINPFFTPVH